MTTKRYIALIIALLTLAASLVYVYSHDNRESIKSLSSKTEEHLDSLAQRHSEIIASISVTIVDLNTNERFIVYVTSNVPELKTLVERKLFQSAGQPLFTQNDEYNNRIIKILNGEFVCSPYRNTIGSVDIPGSADYISVVCARGIPPGFGDFKGIVSVFLKKKPTVDQVDHLRNMMDVASSLIYSTDLK